MPAKVEVSTFPDASNLALPAVSSTPVFMSAKLKLSSMMMSALPARAISSSAILSTSTSTGLPGAISLAALMAAGIPPQAAMWFSLIRNAS